MSHFLPSEIKNVFYSFPEPVIIADLEGFVLYINLASERALGYSSSEALGLPLSRFFTDTGNVGLKRTLKDIGHNKSSFFETKIQAKFGREIKILLSYSPILGKKDSPTGCLFMFRDISDFSNFTYRTEKSAKTKMRKTPEWVFDDIREGIVVTDTDGKIIYANPTAGKIFGYTKGDLLGNRISILFATKESGRLSKETIEITKTSGWWEGQITGMRKGGGEFGAMTKTSIMTDEAEKPVSIVWTTRDISDEVEMHAELLHINRELLALYAVSKTLSESIEIDELLNISLRKVLEVTGMDVGVIRIFDEKSQDLVLKATIGTTEDYQNQYNRLPLEGSVSGKVLKTGVPHLVRRDDGDDYKNILIMKDGLAQTIIVPLRSKSLTLGTMSVGGYNLSASSSQDINLLTSIGSLIGMALEHAITLERAETLAKEKDIKVQELTVLSDISRALLTTIKLDKLLYIVLTAVTMGESFGFNRAALFLVDEEENAIVGRMGVGPLNADEAGKIWSELDRQELSLFDLVDRDFDEQASYEAIQIRAVRKIKIPLSRRDDVVIRSIMENRPIIVTDARANPNVDKRMLRLLMGEEVFAVVPIVVMGRPLGAILVDNIFNKKPIMEDDIALLSAFANQAGLAIQNSILYTNQERINRELRAAQIKLLQQAKLVGLGEMAAEVAHEIRNPLVSIGGFARKISNLTPKDAKIKMYSDIVTKEVQKLENTLSNILSLPKDIPPSITEVDLNRVIRDTLNLVRDDLVANRIRLDTELDDLLPNIEADPAQLQQVFLNLFLNALQAMEGGGTLKITTSLFDILGVSFVRVEVSDTGAGIPLELIGNIFRPFFTTKKAGTGLGLTITHKIITSHGGNIDIINRKEGGVTFVVELPVKQANQDTSKAHA